MTRSRYVVVLIKPLKGLELVPSLPEIYKKCLSYSTVIFDVRSNFHYIAMSMVMPQILKAVDFTKTQKCRYFKNDALFFLQIKKFINYSSKAIL